MWWPVQPDEAGQDLVHASLPSTRSAVSSLLLLDRRISVSWHIKIETATVRGSSGGLPGKEPTENDEEPLRWTTTRPSRYGNLEDEQESRKVVKPKFTKDFPEAVVRERRRAATEKSRWRHVARASARGWQVASNLSIHPERRRWARMGGYVQVHWDVQSTQLANRKLSCSVSSVWGADEKPHSRGGRSPETGGKWGSRGRVFR